MLRDYYVKFLPRERIAEAAADWRRAGGFDDQPYFNVVQFVENVLRRRFTRKGPLQIEFLNETPADQLAYVTFNPLTLHIDKEIWTLARQGDPYSRFVIAHEIGHILFHDHYARAFSSDPAMHLKFPRDENKAEWQANTFAGLFLVSDRIVAAFGDAHMLAGNCAILMALAEDRLAEVNERRRQGRPNNCDICAGCGNSIVVTGLLARCQICGKQQEKSHI